MASLIDTPLHEPETPGTEICQRRKNSLGLHCLGTDGLPWKSVVTGRQWWEREQE